MHIKHIHIVVLLNLTNLTTHHPAPENVKWPKRATTSAIEAAAAIAYNTMPLMFSAQILVDCANSAAGINYFQCSGCNGGDPTAAFQFMNQFTIPLVSLN